MNINDRVNQLEKQVRELNDLKGKVIRLETLASDIEKKITPIDRTYGSTVADVRTLRSDLESVETRVSALEARLKVVEDRLGIV